MPLRGLLVEMLYVETQPEAISSYTVRVYCFALYFKQGIASPTLRLRAGEHAALKRQSAPQKSTGTSQRDGLATT